MHLDRYSRPGDYTPGAPLWKQLLWYFVGCPLVRCYWLPFSGLKVALLRLFGARLGCGMRIKPGVVVKFPWRLHVGNFVWIGEQTWIDNLAPVTIGDNVCISQGVYLCTGNHDWSAPNFDLRIAPIVLEASCWVAARATVGPGVTVGEGAVLGLGSTAGQFLEPWTIYAGNPAVPLKRRQLRSETHS